MLETSNHDEYCSRSKCEYCCDDYSVELYINENHLVSDDTGAIINLQSYEIFIPVPNVDASRSHHCDLSDESAQHGLDVHEYRITIKSVTKQSTPFSS